MQISSFCVINGSLSLKFVKPQGSNRAKWVKSRIIRQVERIFPLCLSFSPHALIHFATCSTGHKAAGKSRLVPTVQHTPQQLGLQTLTDCADIDRQHCVSGPIGFCVLAKQIWDSRASFYTSRLYLWHAGQQNKTRMQ